MTDATPHAAGRAWLADWRRRIAELYAEIRVMAEDDPAAAWETWRDERELLYRTHPQSPVRAGERAGFHAGHWPYDERFRFEAAIESPAASPDAAADVAPAPITLPNSGADDLAFDRIGVVRLGLPESEAALPVFWMRGYAGGLFLPVGDATNGAETYGAGRYVLDTGKGADLGGDPGAGTLVVDLNFAFHPSCAFDPRWACPLAPPESRLRRRVEAGERLR